jgi:predicted Holliday junction resolvase-like endonuclease
LTNPIIYDIINIEVKRKEVIKMTNFEIMYNELRRYGEIIADKSHETTEGHFIRFTSYKFEDVYYVVTMFDGVVFSVAEKEDIKELL